MRVSDQSRHQLQLQYLQTVTARLDQLSQQLATNKRIQKPSDDPQGVASSLGYRSEAAFEVQMQRNIDSASTFLNVTESALDSATQSVQRLRELAVQASSDTISAQERQVIGSEADQLLRQLVQVGNTNFNGVYIFSGLKSATPAFSVTGEPPAAVTFDGDSGQRLRRISESDTVAVNVPGSAAFGSLFDDLIQFRQDLTSGAPGSTIRASLSKLDSALDRILNARADLGARSNRLDATKAQSQDTSTNLQQLQANVEDVDLADAIVRLNAQQNALQAALGAIGKASQATLLDYLR